MRASDGNPGKMMRRALASGLVFTVLMGIFVSVLPSGGVLAASSDKSSELAKVNKQINSTRAKLTQSKKQESSALHQLETAQKNLQATQQRIDGIERDLRVTGASVQQLQRDLVLAQKDLDQAESDLDSNYVRFSRRVRAVYESGALDYLELITSANDFSDLIVRIELMERLIASDVSLYKEVQAQKREVEAKKARIQETKAKLEERQTKMASLKVDASREAGRLRDQAGERERMLKKIQSQRRELERALDEEERSARELESFIRGQQKGETVKSTTPSKQFIWPVRGPITSEFGWRVHPILKTKRYHSGLDIAVPYGTPVAAAGSGKVILSGWVGGYGNTVAIDHGNGISTLYGHNSVLLVRVGQTVTQGQIIAKAGSTGLSTGPHCHFEVRVNGSEVNPHNWLR